MKKNTGLFLILNFSFFILKAQTGIISTVGGSGTAGYNGDNRQATTAELNQDGGVAVDAAGNVYIADFSNHRIRKVSTAGVITTIAGTGVSGFSGDGGQATAAKISFPECVRVDTLGNIYFSEAGNAVIRKINNTGRISTIAGIPGIGGYSGNGGQATAAELNNPVGLSLDRNLNVYIADQANNVIRKITVSTGVITTVAGNHTAGYSGNGGQATAAKLNNPTGVAVDANGNIFIADYMNNVVRKVTTTGVINAFAGTTVANFNGFSGLADTTELFNPTGVSVSAVGNIYIADAGNGVVREVFAANNQMYVIAGIVDDGYSGDGGPAVNAEVNYPFDMIEDKSNNVFIADLGNNRVRKITAGCSGDIATAVVYNYPECFGNTDGILFASYNSVFEPYSYVWSPSGNTDQQVSGLSAGTYTVSITDGLGCTATTSVDLTQPTLLTASASVVSNVNCRGSSSGSAHVTAGGGSGPYGYSWAPAGGTSTTASNLSAGTYTVIVTDFNGCSATASATITQPATGVSITMASHTNVNCFGGTGDATANAATGGTSPYTYTWSPSGGTNLAATNLSAGTYTIIATDNHGCAGTASVTITQPASAVTITMANHTNVNCFGGTGNATGNAATGGTSPYVYTWSPSGGTNLAAANLSAGTYTITATDNHGCAGTASVTITQPASAVTITMASHTNVNCFGGTGNATANAATGGTSPYIYTWSPGGGTNLTTSNITAGTYTITATDNHGCAGTTSVTITQPATGVAITMGSVIFVRCHGGTGDATANAATGGTSPYTYAWSPSGGTGLSAFNITAGTYTITATDNHGCTGTASATLTQPTALAVTHDSVAETSGCNGLAAVTASGGVSPYTYLWSVSLQTTDTIKNQCSGTYCCTITDNNGCSVTTCVTINLSTGENIVMNTSGINIYPNPTSGQFTIQSSVGSNQLSIEIYNGIGQKVYSQFAICNSQFVINISDQPNGVYLIRILNKDGTLVSRKKVVKTN